VHSRNLLIASVALLVLAGAGAIALLLRGGEPGGGLRLGGSRATPATLEPGAAPALAAEDEPAARPGEDPARESVAAAGVGTAAAVLVLLDPDGRALGDTRCVLFERGRVLQSGATDGAGELALEARESEGAGLLVLATGWAPQVLEPRLEPGRHELRLARGAAVAGRIVVDGRAPTEPLALKLRADHPLILLEAASGLTWGEIEVGGDRASIIELGTDGEGAFRFQGLPADWSGTLAWPRHLWLKERALAADRWFTSVALAAPAEGLRVELTEPARLAGRVVDVPGGAPVSHAGVDPALVFADGTTSRRFIDVTFADAEGRFRVLLANPSLRGGTLAISSGGEFRQIVLDPLEVRGEHDLGDLALHPARGGLTLQLAIEDASGTAVAGAVATIPDGGARPSAPSDESGRTRLEGLSPGPATLRVVALGFQVHEAAISVAADDELCVTLRRTNRLEIRLLTAEGESARGVRALLSAEEHPLESEERWGETYAAAGGSRFEVASDDEEGVTLAISAGRAGRVVLCGVKVGLPLELEVASLFGAILQSAAIDPLGAEEERRLEVRLEAVPRPFQGRVLDDQGRPLADATVGISYRVSSSSSGILSKGTDGEGNFLFEGIYAERLAVTVEKPGHASFHDEQLEVPADGSPVEFRLGAGYEVRVITADEKGRTVAAMAHVRLASGAFVFAEVLEEGLCVLRGLPGEEVTIEVTVNQKTYARSHDPLDPELRVTVPAAGAVEALVRLPAGLEQGAVHYVHLLPAGGDGAMRWEQISSGVTEPTPITFRGVLPGRYEGVVRRFERGQGGESTWTDVTPRTPLVVRAEETTQAAIGP